MCVGVCVCIGMCKYMHYTMCICVRVIISIIIMCIAVYLSTIV